MTNGFPGSAFKEDIVRNDDSGPSMLLKNREDVLEEIELLVARCVERERERRHRTTFGRISRHCLGPAKHP